MVSSSISDGWDGKVWKTNAKCSGKVVAFFVHPCPGVVIYSYWWYLVLRLFYLTSGFA
jgi:hypothetical protein